MLRRLLLVLGGVAATLVLLVLLVVVVTHTDWGRERVRRYVVDSLNERANGRVSVGRASGNLLTGITLDRVVIVDSAGRPFFRAERVSTRYSLLALFSKRVILSELHLLRPVIVLDKRPGAEWNFARIFPSDTTQRDPDQRGFGSWVLLQDVQIQDGHLQIRSEWEPPDSLNPAERQRAIEEALAGRTRIRVVRVPEGYQSLMDLRRLHAQLPRVRLADPDSADIAVDVGQMRTLAELFHPPLAEVRHFAGRFRIGEDSLFATELRVRFPASQLAGDAVYTFGQGGVRLNLRGAPLAFADLRWLYPPLPEQGGGQISLALARDSTRMALSARDMDLRVGAARIAGRFGVSTGDTLRLEDTDLRLAGLDTRLIERLAPTVDIPRDGTLDGHVVLAGTSQAMRLDGDLAFTERGASTSRIRAVGEVGTGERFRMRDLRITVEPLQLALVRTFAPELPLSGTLTGRATLNGSYPGRLDLDSDLTLRDRRSGLSRVRAAGGLATGDSTLRMRTLRVALDPLQLELVRLVAPEFPLQGTLSGRATLDGVSTALRLDSDLTLRERRYGTSRLRAAGEVGTGERVRMRDLRLRAEPVQLAMVRAFAPESRLEGTLAGQARVSGTYPGALRLTGEVSVQEPGAGTSHLRANGGVVTGESLAFQGLRIQLDPLQVALVEKLNPGLPVGGTLSGTATLNGSAASRISARGDLVHEQGAERSHVIARGSMRAGRQPRVDVDAQLLPLSLVTVGRFAPSAQLHGTARGRVQAQGALRDLRLRADLRFAGGGALATDSRLDLASVRKRYDVTAHLGGFNLGAVTRRGPDTDLTGDVLARGLGTDPATLRATLAADLRSSGVDSVRLDSVRLRASVAEGLFHLQQAALRLASAELQAQGSFGLTGTRTGELTYQLRVDSLSHFARWLPPDSGAVAPRPALQAAAVERARADSLRIARATEVERAATGRPAEPMLRVDSVPAIPRDTLAGRLYAAGQMRGNLERFDLSGAAEAQHLVARGNAVGAAQLRYTLQGGGTPAATAEVELQADSLRMGGFALDSLAGHLQYQGDLAGRDAGGTLELRAVQDPRREYRARASFALALDRSELRLAELALRFDTTVWRSTRPGVIAWGEAGVEVEELELRSNHGGRIHADGRLPASQGSGDLRLQLDQVQIGDLVALAQDSVRATGLLSLEARLTGTAADPTLRADVDLVRASYQERELPDTRARLEYADLRLDLDAALLQAQRTLLTATGQVPVNLALSDVTGPRLLERPLAVEVRADSLPLDMLPSFTEAVEDVQGRIVGQVSVRGTPREPDLSGEAELDLGSFRVVSTGVRYRDMVGTLRLQGNQIRIDSLVAHTRGRLRLAGEIDARTLSAPAFDLRVDAEDTQVLNNERGKLYADAELSIQGPLESMAVTGSTALRSGVIYVPEQNNRQLVPLDDPAVTQVVDTAGIEAREVLPQSNPLLAGLQVDVGLRIARDTWVRNTDANVEIYTPDEAGDLRIRMNRRTNTLTLTGTVNTDRGEYSAMGRRLLVRRGAATFQGDTLLNPILHLVAEHEVRLPGREALTIQIHVGGTLRSPTLSLESTAQPPISESDLLSYLAFGRSSSSLLQLQGSGLSGQAGGSGNLVGGVAEMATRQLASVAIGTLVDEFEAETARDLGLDVFRVAPADLPSELSTQGAQSLLLGTEVEAGKYFRRRWFVAGQARPTLVRPGARVEYETPQGFRWIVSYQPRFLPQEPSFALPQAPQTTGVLGTFLRWEWRF